MFENIFQFGKALDLLDQINVLQLVDFGEGKAPSDSKRVSRATAFAFWF